jgi:hypothetical protein
MSETSGIVDGWEIRRRDDGTFGVYDFHGLLAGPFGTKEAAMAAALRLAKPTGRKKPRPPSRIGAADLGTPRR